MRSVLQLYSQPDIVLQLAVGGTGLPPAPVLQGGGTKQQSCPGPPQVEPSESGPPAQTNRPEKAL